AGLAVTAVFLAAYSIPVTFHTVMAVTGGNSIANVTSVTPGGAGVQQAFNVASLKGVTNSTTATAYSTTQQLVTTAWDILFGIRDARVGVRLATQQEPRRGVLRPGQGEGSRAAGRAQSAKAGER